MGLQIRIVGESVALEAGRLHNHFQHLRYAFVQGLAVHGPVRNGFYQFLVLLFRSRCNEGVAGINLGDYAVAAAPVGDNQAFIAPFAQQDVPQQFRVLRGISSVEVVVRSHDRPGFAFPEGDFEILQIQLPQRPHAHARVVAEPVDFLVVGRKVLDRCAHALALDAAHIGRRHFARQHGILREILEIAAAEGVAVQVLAGSQQHVHPVFAHLIADGRAHFLYQCGVPGGRQERADGEGRAVIGAVLTLAVVGDAQAGRSVGKYHGRNAQAGDGEGESAAAGHHVLVGGDIQHLRAVARVLVVGPDQQVCLFLIGHCVDNLRNIVFR